MRPRPLRFFDLYISTSMASSPVPSPAFALLSSDIYLLPVLTGSGYILPSFGEDSDYCELLARELDITVLGASSRTLLYLKLKIPHIDCDYAKGPE